MNKRNIIIIIVIGAILVMVLGYMAFFRRDKNVNESDNLDINYAKEVNMYDKEEILETIEDTTIQGVVELNHNGYIYIFNGQHFGEYGFEMEEYTSANIDNNNQECIDYCTSAKYDTSYIQEGDIIICTGDLKKYSIRDDDLDTKENPIIVLKANDYNTMKKEAVNNTRKAKITIGEYFDYDGEIYIKYQISDKQYNLPFVLKFIITDDTQVIGNLENGKEIKIQYNDLSVSVDELTLKTIEVID